MRVVTCLATLCLAAVIGCGGGKVSETDSGKPPFELCSSFEDAEPEPYEPHDSSFYVGAYFLPTDLSVDRWVSQDGVCYHRHYPDHPENFPLTYVAPGTTVFYRVGGPADVEWDLELFYHLGDTSPLVMNVTWYLHCPGSDEPGAALGTSAKATDWNTFSMPLKNQQDYELKGSACDPGTSYYLAAILPDVP